MEDRTIPLHLIREPEHPVRLAMDQGRLEDLARSIREGGLINPITVRPLADGTYEVVAGHRRRIACSLAGLAEARCRVVEEEDAAHWLRIHENLLREDLSPVDEATYYAQLLPDFGDDVDALAEAVRRRREHVEARLLLLRLDPEVLAALRAGEISLGVAGAIGAMVDPQDRNYFLSYARRTGVTVSVASRWRDESNARCAGQAPVGGVAGQPVSSGSGAPAGPAPGPRYGLSAPSWELTSETAPRPCKLCGKVSQQWEMFRWFVCEPCAGAFMRVMEDQRGG